MLRPNSKIKEAVFFDDDKIIVKKTFDGNDALRDAANARELTQHKFGGDYKHIGNVDMAMLGGWLKDAGVQWTDVEGIKAVLKRKLMSNEYNGLRNWEGSW